MITKTQLLGVLVLGCAVAGCVLDGPEAMVVGDKGLALYVRNETDREVVILVDGAEQLRVAAGQRIRGQQLLVPARRVYTVVARTIAGHELGSFTTDTPGQFGAPGFVKNLRCGDIWVWVGHDVSAEIAPLPPELQNSCG